MRLQHRRTRSRPERVRRSRPGHPFRGLEGTPRMRRRRIRPIAGQDRSARVTAPGRVVARMRLMPGPRHRICRYGRTWISLCGSAGAGLSLPSEAASCGRGHGQAGPGAAFDQSATAPALGDLAPVSARSAPRRTIWGGNVLRMVPGDEPLPAIYHPPYPGGVRSRARVGLFMRTGCHAGFVS